MQLRLIRLRARRRLRKGQRQVEDLSYSAEQNIERHFFKRFGNLIVVRRFVIGWIGLMFLIIGILIFQNITLSSYYQTLKPVAGGIYNEGILGTFTNANPMYATSDVDTSVSKLIFASLFTYDDHNKLVGDLANSYSVDPKGTTYTVHLKPNLVWQDMQPLTSADVVYTYQAIENPDALSPLRSGWQGVSVSAPDKNTVVFKLPDPLASFPYNMTNGIVPKHILGSIAAADLRSADFNTLHPVGAGPFQMQAIQVNGGDPSTAEEQIALVPFASYHSGKPKLQEFVVHAYAANKALVGAMQSNQLNGVEGLDAVPSELAHMTDLRSHNLVMTAATMVFFKTSSGVLADSQVRQALVQSANVTNIISQLGYPTHTVREPLLADQLAYDPSYRQAGYNLNSAQTILNNDGWLMGKDGLRHKAGQILQFNLLSADTPEYHMVMDNISRDWQKLGVRLQPQFLGQADFQSAITGHQYDAVLYGISIGVDPDVFAYWDSSQADVRSNSRLNLSEYKNAIADASLEAGRTRLDPALRVIKYKPFLQQWQQDNPALGLYQPRLLYLTSGMVAGLNDHVINTPSDRFSNVSNWEIRQAKVTD